MASSTMTRVVEVTKITPEGSAANGQFVLPLTFFDTLWFTFSPVERLFFYHLPAINHHIFNSQILSKLKKSLSHVLVHFLPLAGNLIWPSPEAAKPIILYTPNDGVSLTVAESNNDFNRLSDNEIHKSAIELHPLVPQLDVSDDRAAVMALQVTLFPNQGFSIGMTTHHTVVDGKSVVMFAKAWAYTRRMILQYHNQEINPSVVLLSLPLELTPSFERTGIKDPTKLDILYLNQRLDYFASSRNSDPKIRRSLKVSQNLGGVDQHLVRATFQLSREHIKKLRDLVLSKIVQSKPIHLSTFVLTMAYTMTCMVKARDPDPKDGEVFWLFVADYRKRLNFPVPENYFGNCVCSHANAAKERDLADEENGLVFIAEKLSDEVKGLEKVNVLDGWENRVLKNINARKDPEVRRMISVAGSPHFQVYEPDFGWGRPKKVENVSIDRSGAMALAESGDGSGGIEIGLALEKHEMETFASLFKGKLA